MTLGQRAALATLRAHREWRSVDSLRMKEKTLFALRDKGFAESLEINGGTLWRLKEPEKLFCQRWRDTLAMSIVFT